MDKLFAMLQFFVRLCWFPFCQSCEVCAWLHEESTQSSTESGPALVRSWKSTPITWYLYFSLESYKSHFRSMIFIYVKGLMTKWTFLIKQHSILTGSCCTNLRELQCAVCALWLSKNGFSMFYNPVLIQLWRFLSYFYLHFSLIEMCLFLAPPDPTCYLKTNLSRAGFAFQHKTLLTSFLNLLNRASGSSLPSQADNRAFCTSTLLSGGKKVNYVNYVTDREVCCFWATAKFCSCSLLFDLPCNGAHETKPNTCDAPSLLPFLRAWTALTWELPHIPLYPATPQGNHPDWLICLPAGCAGGMLALERWWFCRASPKGVLHSHWPHSTPRVTPHY